MKRTIKLSTWIELLKYTKGKDCLWGWWFCKTNRPDMTLYPTREEAMNAATPVLKTRMEQRYASIECEDEVEIEQDDPPLIEYGLKRVKLLQRGEKRRRAGGHGYSGGDGFVRLD